MTGAVDESERALARQAIWEPQLRAFAWCDADRVRAQARRVERRLADGDSPLYGVPVGVKDIFDTAGIPTEYGSPIFSGRTPDRSAVAVTRLAKAGAILFGKTVTAELAYFAPGPTTNPWNAARTPGGSSMGSAAAVGAGVIPAAIGTQTNGSVIRPAAFCGVVGFKPTFGRLSRAGVLRFSPSLDQLGVFAASVAHAARLAAVLAGEPTSQWASTAPRDAHPRIAVVRTPEWVEVESETREHFDAAVSAAASAGVDVLDVELPEQLAASIPVHRTIMAADAHRWVRPLLGAAIDRCSPQLRELLDEGAAVTPDDYAAARRDQVQLTAQFTAWAAGFAGLITPAVLGEAPGIATTGDPRCCTRWSLVGAPAITLPNGLSRGGLPLAVQLVGLPGGDRELLELAAWIEPLLPALGAPPTPDPAG